MTKRFGSYQNTNGKKPKLDEDELWDDDLDADALDRCFELATQVCVDDVVPIQSKDASILPTYNAFKNPSAFSSSTQANISSIASTSKVLSLHELESENRSLKQQNKEKEGEISILRSKLKESATVVQVEQKKTTNEWREKLYVTQKEVKAVKSELEFKRVRPPPVIVAKVNFPIIPLIPSDQKKS